MFYLPADRTVEQLLEALTAVRQGSGIGKSIQCEVPLAIAVRGTAREVAVAGRAIDEKNLARR